MAKVSNAPPTEAASRGSDPLNPTVVRGVAIAVALALLVTVAVTTALRSFPTPSDAAVGSGIAGAADNAVEGQVARAYGKLPLSFIPNAGQADPRVRYAAQGPGFAVSFTPGEALLSFVKGERGHTLALRFLEANQQADLTGRHLLPGTVNYLLGDHAEWRSGIPTYQEVVYRDLWPGVDAVFRGGEGTLKYEFHLAPGARASDVRLGYRGADRVALGGGGELLINTPLGTLGDAPPLSYQWIGGSRLAVDSRYVVAPDGTYGFALGPGYDPRLPLIIDPELVYSTFLGSGDYDVGNSIAVDSAGHAYVTGYTGFPPGSPSSPDFPTTPGAFDTAYNGEGDAFVTKLSPDGSALVYSTYLGGGGVDRGMGIAVDSAGHAFLSGNTASEDFPTTPDAFDTSLGGGLDTFVTKLSADGSALVYSTFVGGQGGEFDGSIAIDEIGHAHLTGWTTSRDFPTTPGAFDTVYNGGGDTFVTKLSSDGAALVYSTFLGGANHDDGSSLGIDSAGHAHVTGYTGSPGFPATPGAFDTTYNGLGDGYVTKLSADGSALAYSTFLGGVNSDSGFGIAVDRAHGAYVTGPTSSPDFPTTPDAFDATYNGGSGDAFVTNLSSDGSALVYSTFLGGEHQDLGRDIAVGPDGHAYITGGAQPGFPTTPGAFDRSFNGGSDSFVTKLRPDGSALAYSTFLGGASFDEGYGIAIRTGVVSAGHAYVTGWTESRDFPTTPGAFDTTYNGALFDAFVSKFVIGDKAT
jgi:hypothetical protein